MASHPVDLKLVKPEQWVKYYLYAMSRLSTAVSVFTDLTADPRRGTKQPPISRFVQHDFVVRMLDELAWVQTVYQMAVIKGDGNALPGHEVLQSFTRVITNNNLTGDRYEFCRLADEAKRSGFKKLNFTAVVWWVSQIPIPGTFRDMDQLVASYKHDKHIIKGLLKIAKTTARDNAMFNSVGGNDPVVRSGVAYEMGCSRLLSEVSVALVEQRMAEARKKMDLVRTRIEALGGKVDNREQNELLQAIYRGEYDDELANADASH